MTRIYVAGPMTGIIESNYPAFVEMTATLRAAGHHVVAPNEINAGLEHQGWSWCIRRDIEALLTVEAIVLLPGWQRSRGALLEHQIATSIGLDIAYPPGEGPDLP